METAFGVILFIIVAFAISIAIGKRLESGDDKKPLTRHSLAHYQTEFWEQEGKNTNLVREPRERDKI